MDPVELNIVTLTHSVSESNSYAVVLKEKDGQRRIPIVIGGFEAQAIAIALEDMPTGRPLTHDLIKNSFDELSVELESVFIRDLKDGIFYAVLNCKQNGETYQIDARPSDSIALAVRFGCPIFTTNRILDEAGIYVQQDIEVSESEDEEKDVVDISSPESQKLDDLSLTKLNELMDEMLEKENYEEAARIRDAIKRKQS